MVTRRKFTHHLGFATASVAFAACAPTRGCLETHSRDQAGARLDALKTELPRLSEYAREAIPGFQVAAIVDGEVTWADGYGLRDTTRPDQVGPHTIFEAASLSKPVMAFMALQLVDEGLLQLDRPLVEYMVFPDIGEDPRAHSVTTRHVLTHVSGLPTWRDGDGLRFNAEPGSRFGYSGEPSSGYNGSRST